MAESARKKRGQAIQEYLSTHKDAETELLSEEPKKFDPTASTEECIEDLRRVQEEHPDNYITRRFYRKYGQYSDSTWDSKFGTFQEFRRQARLELSRGQHKLEHNIAKHASLDIIRGFAETEVMPWCGKYERGNEPGRWKTIVVASDFHDVCTNKFALGVFLDTVKRVQPDKVILAGDVFDNYAFSRFDHDPRACDIAGHLKFVRENIFRPLREVSSAQIDMITGNHENHLLRHIANRTPEIRVVLSDFMGVKLCDLFGLPEFEINMICKSDLAVFSPSDIRKEIAKNYATYYGCLTVSHYEDPKFTFGTSTVSGHTHKPKLITSANVPLGAIWNMTLGCMCEIDNCYTESQNRNQNGFGIVHIDTHTKATIPEPIIFGDNFAMVGGTRYIKP
jgi:hypothetical protein